MPMKGDRRQRRLVVMLDDDAYALLAGLTTPRRKGAYLSDLIRRAAGTKAGEQPQGVELLQSIEARLARIEEKLAAAEGGKGSAAMGPTEELRPPESDSSWMR
jgi:hypothetical protein